MALQYPNPFDSKIDNNTNNLAIGSRGFVASTDIIGQKTSKTNQKLC